MKSNELDNEAVKMLEFEQKEIKKRINRLKRSDSGAKRLKYSSSLPVKYRKYLYSANKRCISFSLSVYQFNVITSGLCRYCGSGSKIGIDRVDSSIGYELGNCVPCCTSCNWMKLNSSINDFLSHIKKIYFTCCN
jgi:hypothetical protein